MFRASGSLTAVANRWHLRDAKNAPLSANIRLHYDASGKYLVIYGPAVHHAISSSGNAIASDPDFSAQQFDGQFFSRRFNSVARLSTEGANEEWIPAYGGGFSAGGMSAYIVQ